jgi:mannose/fructose-specific phosphotransferase system component IIA
MSKNDTPLRGLIIAHADLADALITTVSQIAGPQENLVALSNTNLSAAELERRIRELLEDGVPTIIFTDFLGGSAFAAARSVVHACRLENGTPCAVITGVNLPMLISFVTKRQSHNLYEFIDILREDGHRGIQ